MGFNPGLSPALRGREPTPKNLKLMLMGGCRTGLHWVPPGLILASPRHRLRPKAHTASAFPFARAPSHFWDDRNTPQGFGSAFRLNFAKIILPRESGSFTA